MTGESIDQGRRSLIRGAFGVAGFAMYSIPAFAAPRGRVSKTPRKVALYNVNTDERERVVYWANGGYIDDALKRVDQLLRDHHSGEVRRIEPRLLDLLSTLSYKLGATQSFEVVSGYRSPASNAALAKQRRGVSHDSLHIQGMAVDVVLPGHELDAVRDAAVALRMGGVGYYPRSGFVHLDVGPVRYWEQAPERPRKTKA